eukprot:4984514-Pleurochrysis_carterae.AAC.1
MRAHADCSLRDICVLRRGGHEQQQRVQPLSSAERKQESDAPSVDLEPPDADETRLLSAIPASDPKSDALREWALRNIVRGSVDCCLK